MGNISNLVADVIIDEDPHDIVGAMIENNTPMCDNQSHFISKLERNLKFGAKNKLGKGLVEAKKAIDIKINEFYVFVDVSERRLNHLELDQFFYLECPHILRSCFKVFQVCYQVDSRPRSTRKHVPS